MEFRKSIELELSKSDAKATSILEPSTFTEGIRKIVAHEDKIISRPKN